MVSLGALPEPGTDEPVLRLGLARHFIDLLNVLEEKTKGNLSGRGRAVVDVFGALSEDGFSGTVKTSGVGRWRLGARSK